MSLNNIESLKETVEAAWEDRDGLAPGRAPAVIAEAVEACLDGLETGQLRVAEPLGPPG